MMYPKEIPINPIINGMSALKSDSVCPLPDRLFEQMKKQLSPEDRKKFEAKHKELNKIRAKHELENEIKLSKILDTDALMRFAYVPFVIANLAWDYADTVVSLSAVNKQSPTKKLSRAVRELKREYDLVRAPYIDTAHRNSEEDNMYVFEDGVKDLFSLYLKNIEFDLKTAYPQLEMESIMFLKAVYQCHIVLQALYKYVEMQKRKVEKIVGHTIGDVLPSSLRRLDILIIEYVGDKPIGDHLMKQQSTYANCLANRIALIELTETKVLEDVEQ